MECDQFAIEDNRPLTKSERNLARWMLEHGIPEAKEFLPQLELVEVTPFRCECGCATIDFKIRGMPHAPPGVHILADFVFGDEANLNGIFIDEKQGILSGMEVFGYTGEAPKSLPDPEQLVDVDSWNRKIRGKERG